MKKIQEEGFSLQNNKNKNGIMHSLLSMFSHWDRTAHDKHKNLHRPWRPRNHPPGLDMWKTGKYAHKDSTSGQWPNLLELQHHAWDKDSLSIGFSLEQYLHY